MLTDIKKLDRIQIYIQREITFIDEQLEKIKNNIIKASNGEIKALTNQLNLLYTLDAVIRDKCTGDKEPF